MRRVLSYTSAVLLLVFPLVLQAAFPAVSANTWSPAQPLTVSRSGAATVLLQDGRLLITGGNNGVASVASVDIVDAAGNITAGPPMNMARSQHTATVLQDGRVLVAGGVDVSGNPIGTAEIFDPNANSAQTNPWTSTGPVAQARSGQTATLLHDGTVLLAGGLSGNQVLSTLELFNAASGTNGSFTLLGATLSSPRAKHAAALLEDGRVLIVGGWDGTMVPTQPPATTGTPRPLASTDIYDPSAQQVRAGPALNAARMSLTATTQIDGQIFVAGGNDGTQDLASTETFDPIASPQPAAFTLSNLSLTTPRSSHLAFLLPHNGGTLLVGGTSNGTALASAELYMPVYLSQSETATLTPVPNAMSAGRVYATASPLSDGSATSVNDGLLLVAGGTDASGNILSSAEYFGFAWVKTDAPDYAPGTPVNITGGGFQPGETVTLHFQEFPYYDAPPDATAVVQGDGTFSNSSFAPDAYDLNIGFFLTATGSASGRQAQTIFTDSNPNQVTVGTQNSPNPVPAGTSATFPVTVTFNGAANVPCTVDLSVASLPAGASLGGFSPASLSNTSNGQSTLTIQTTPTAATGSHAFTVTATPEPGSCQNTSTKSGNGTLAVAPPTPTTLAVAAATGTYGGTTTLQATLKTSGGTPVSGQSVSFTLNGNAVGNAMTTASGIATLSGVSLSGINVNTYNTGVAASFSAAAGFASSSGSGSLTVNAAPLSITPDGSKSKTYGQVFSAFTGTTSGLVGTDVVTVTYGSTGAVATAALGTYDITVASYSFTTGSATNYQVTENTASKGLTVSAAALTITAKSTSKIYGQTVTFAGTEFTTGGLLNSDTVTGVTLTSTGAAATANVSGTPYDIVPSNAAGTGLSNYIISYVSGTLTVNPAPATVVADSLTRIYGDANPTLTAKTTGTVNNDVLAYTLATAAGQFSGVGAYPITVTLGSNPNYTVTPTDGTLTITPRPATVIADSLSKTYGDLNPTLTAKTSGTVNNDSLNYSLATTVTQFTGVGAYPITVTLGSNPNYTVTPTDGTLTINPRPATVVADSLSKTYGDANPTLSAKTTGTVNNDVLAYTLATTAAQFTGVGAYPITVTLGSNPNYTVTPTDGTLTINPRPATVVADSLSKTYGDLNPTLTAKTSGTVNNDVLAYTLATTVTQFTGVGGYPITVTAGLNPNYTVTLTTGTLTINPRPATVVADGLSKTYGDANPTLTAKTTGTVNNDVLAYTLATTVSQFTGVGGYPITVTVGSNPNYTVTPTDGTLTITPRPATVVADNLTKTYGDLNPALTAKTTGTVGNDSVVYTLTTTAVQFSNVGAYPITVTLGANPNYTVTPTDSTLTINQRPAAITVDNKSRNYGDPNPTLTASVSGTVNGDLLNYTLDTTASQASNVGTCPITITPGANPNYALTATNGTLTINQRPATLTADNKSRNYGDPNPTLTATVSGTVNGDLLSYTLDTTASQASNVGTYPITITPGANPNYALTATNGTLTINQRPATLTADNKSRNYGDPNPTLTATVSGTVNGDLLSYTLDTAASQTSVVGSFPITITLGSNLNYAVTPTDGALTINQRPATVIAGSVSRTYGEPNPTLAATVSGTVNGDSLAYTLSTTAGQFSSVGAYPITVMVGSNPNYAVTPTDGTLTISPRPATIVADSLSKTYGDPNPALTAKVSGTVNGDIVDYSLSTDATQFSTAGSYAITVTLGSNPNYSFIATNGTLTINQHPATITIANAGRTYGDPNPAFTAAVTGTINGDTLNYSLGTSATQTSGIGSYSITASLGNNPNYSVSVTNGTLSISPRPAGVTAANASKTYGDATPTFTANVTGNVNGDTLSYSLSTTAVQMSPVGSYTILVTLGANPNYSVTATNGTLTINPATPTAVSITNLPSPALIGGAFTPAVVVTASPAGDPGATTVTSSTPAACIVNAGTVQFVAVGTCSLTASVAAITNYNAWTGAAQTFPITYGFLGLEAPYAAPPITFNVQRTMPIVWQYTNAKGAVVNSAAANPVIQISGPFQCGMTDSASDITVNDAGNSGYQYNSATSTWQFNWQVKGNLPGCYNISIVNGQTGQVSGPFAIDVVSH